LWFCNFEAVFAISSSELHGLSFSLSTETKGFGERHYVGIMLFLGMANAYIMRTNMSVAIGEIIKLIHLENELNHSQFAVAMVNHTAIHHEAEIFDDECPETDYGNQTVVEQDGEFEWSTSKQGWILSSFFYGYVLTQVTMNRN
jgi:MFS transporter, ACS family, solute carrier family 17 (sodium-dependent inorganic phosphate cotransporter), member 5